MLRPIVTVLIVLLSALPLAAAEDTEVKITVTPVRGGVSMLTGQGGNMALAVGSDRVVLIDDQFAPLTDKIRAAAATVTDLPLGFVVNTHWHGDHTGGNENLGQTGSVIVAHENVRRRMAAGQLIEFLEREVAPAASGALPVVTFTDEATIHVGGLDVQIRHLPPAHTDGDSIVVFEGLDVIHTGDIVFNGLYPFIDTSSGGSLNGVIAAVEEILLMTTAETVIIPGHGPITDRRGLEAYHALLVDVRDRVAALLDAGHDLDAILAAAPTAAYDEVWGTSWLTGEQFTRIAVDSLSRER